MEEEEEEETQPIAEDEEGKKEEGEGVGGEEEEEEETAGGDTASIKSKGSEDTESKSKKEDGKGDEADESTVEEKTEEAEDEKTEDEEDEEEGEKEEKEGEDEGEEEEEEGGERMEPTEAMSEAEKDETEGEEGDESEEVVRTIVKGAADSATSSKIRRSRMSRIQDVVDSQEPASDSEEDEPERKESDTVSISQALSDHLDTVGKEEKMRLGKKSKPKKKVRAGGMTLFQEDLEDATADDEGVPPYPWEGSCSSSSSSSSSSVTAREERLSASEASVAFKEEFSRENLIETYKKLTKEKFVLKRKNIVLAKRVNEYFKQKKWIAYISEMPVIEPQQETRYKMHVKMFDEYLEREADVRNKMDVTLKELETRMMAHQEEEKAVLDSIMDRQKEIGMNLISERTGKQMTQKMMDRLTGRQIRSVDALKVIRTKYIKVRDAEEAKEQELRKLECLGEGLYLKDYEQLRMENQSYCDKIEERDEELTQLRNRATSTIQVLAHIREKANATAKNIQELYEDLEYTEYEAARNREFVAIMKKHRDDLRAEHKRMKDEAGLLVHKRLVEDFEKSAEDSKRLTSEITNLKRRFATGLVRLQATRKSPDLRHATVAARLLLEGKSQILSQGLVEWLSSKLEELPAVTQTVSRTFLHRLTDHHASIKSEQSSVVIAVKRTRPGFFPPLKHFLEGNY